MFIGFVPLSHNVKGGVQGWKVNGQEFTFTNCDGNPNSYFSVLFNANKPGYTSYNGWKNPLMYAWYNLATQVPVSEELPDALFSPDYEIHHGGCGGYSIGTTEGDITGVAIGQRFGESNRWPFICTALKQCMEESILLILIFVL